MTSVTQLLASRVPGVAVTDGSGTTGSATRVLIRGAASISLSNQPLVFIDGVRVDGGFRALFNVSGSGNATSGQAPSTLNDINPNDIESIEIVKGPAAATLYGADASAGVIQIITKKGRVGSRSFSQDHHDRVRPDHAKLHGSDELRDVHRGARSPDQHESAVSRQGGERHRLGQSRPSA